MTRRLTATDSPRRRLRFAQARAALLLSLLFMVVYGGCNALAARRAEIGTLCFAWERHIPLIPLMIIPYMSIDLFFVTAPFLCRDERELRLFAKRIAFAILVAGCFFIVMPLRLTFPRPVVGGWLGAIFQSLYSFDQPHNLFPSLHITLRTILADKFIQRSGRAWRWPLHVWFSLIGFSTVFTWQHQVLDVVGGFILAIFCFYFFREAPLRADFTPNPGLARFYGELAALFLALALLAWPWGSLLLWPACALALEAAAYVKFGPGIYRKENGSLPFCVRVILWPCLLGHHVSWHYYKRQCHAWDEVAQGVWLGRRLTDSECERLVEKGIGAVLDVTAEFSEAPRLLKLNYLNIPILDLTAPTAEQLADGVRFIEAHRARGVYVHCKIGYSRSAALVGAWLLQYGHAQTAAEAAQRLRICRPHVHLRPEAVATLERIERSPLDIRPSEVV